MHHDDTGTPDALDPDYVPETIVNREEEYAVLTDAFTDNGMQYLYIYGDRGTGKTLVTRSSLAACPDHMATCYISCIRFDTQYQVLKQVYRTLTGDDINNGHHTAQLQHQVEAVLADRPLLLVLDEIDFLLANDGNDLLYYLSRLNNGASVTIVAISSTHATPESVIEERALSSLQPWHITFDPYTAMQAHDILEERLREADLVHAVDRDTLIFLVSKTRNIRLGLHWLAQAVATARTASPSICFAR